jgi:hypothetical protein
LSCKKERKEGRKERRKEGRKTKRKKSKEKVYQEAIGTIERKTKLSFIKCIKLIYSIDTY